MKKDKAPKSKSQKTNKSQKIKWVKSKHFKF